MIREALIVPKKEGTLKVSYRNMMSVQTPKFEFSVKTNDSGEFCNYGMAFTSGELDAAVVALNGILEKMLRMAELEKTAQLLAEEIERTRRRVNALEHILMPRYLEIISSIRMRLEENERGNITRLMKVKDMMLRDRVRQDDEDEAEQEENF